MPFRSDPFLDDRNAETRGWEAHSVYWDPVGVDHTPQNNKKGTAAEPVPAGLPPAVYPSIETACHTQVA